VDCSDYLGERIDCIPFIIAENITMNRPMLPIIQSLWIGAPLSNLEKLCVQSFLDHGHEFHLYTYADVGGVPDGATVKDGNEILPEGEIFRNDNGSVAGFSDYFRFALLAERGGWWMDMDFVCIKPLSFDDDIVFGVLPTSNSPLTGAMRFPKRHPVMLELKAKVANMPNKEGGSYNSLARLFGETVRKNDMGKYAKPFMCFYPLPLDAWACVFDDSFRGDMRLYPDTHAVHIWWNRISDADFDKNAVFPAGSLIEQLKSKHGIAPASDAPRITSDELHVMLGKMRTETRIQRKQTARRRKKRETILAVAAVGVVVAFAFSLFMN